MDGEDYSIGTGLCFKSVGYKTLPVCGFVVFLYGARRVIVCPDQFPGLPHDPELHVIPSKAGRVARGEEASSSCGAML